MQEGDVFGLDGGRWQLGGSDEDGLLGPINDDDTALLHELDDGAYVAISDFERHLWTVWV